jgi:hypothetical protein
VLRLEHHGDAARLENLLDRGRDLRGQVLLGLQPPRIDVDQPRDLGEPDHALHRHIGDMRLADERGDVVLAVRGERDIADQHRLVVRADLREGAVEHVGRALAVAAEQLFVGIDDAGRRLHQTLAIGIIAGERDQHAHGGLCLLARRPLSRRLRGGADVVGQWRSREGLDDSVHDGLSVRPVPRFKAGAGGVTGARHIYSPTWQAT